MAQVNIPTVKLNNGLEMPVIGLGTYHGEDTQLTKSAVKTSLKLGYRHFDCAWLYGNEADIGEAIKEAIAESNGKLKREDLFLVSKVWNTHHSKDLVRKSLEETLKNLQVDYVDLFLIHWPMGLKENTDMEPIPKDAAGKPLYSDVHYLETYHAMEELAREGKIKSLGVSNFNIRQMKEILDNCQIKPVNNQIEVNPYVQNTKLIEFCQSQGIVVSAFTPVGGGKDSYPTRPDLKVILQNDVLRSIAEKHKKSVAQVVIRWGLQRSLVMLPKSSTPSRILENGQVFDFTLSDEDMASIKALDLNLRVYPYEDNIDHKHYPFLED